jgi:hypothetical protein
MNFSTKIKLLGSLLPLFMTTSASCAIDLAGKTLVASNQAQAISSGGSNIRPLKHASEIFSNEVVTTGAASKIHLRMIDGGMIALKENSELIIADYQLKDEDGKGSVVLELVQGNLRSISGSIKRDGGSYQLKTHIANLGIRGTHYEVQLTGSELFIAVWDGAVDVSVEVGTSGQDVSLGEGEGFSFAKIDQAGVVFELLEPPQTFNSGHSSDPQDDPDGSTDEKTAEDEAEPASDEAEQASGEAEQASDEAEPASDEAEQASGEAEPASGEAEQDFGEVGQVTEEADIAAKVTDIPDTEVFEDIVPDLQPVIDSLQSQDAQSIYDLVAAREGSITYSDATTSNKNLSDFSLGLEINFDSGEISNGQLSFNDDQNNGEWNAVFNGNMNITQDNVFLEVDITSASHGNNIADGDISAQFLDSLGLNSVIGEFELHDDEASVSGSYQVKGQ